MLTLILGISPVQQQISSAFKTYYQRDSNGIYASSDSEITTKRVDVPSGFKNRTVTTTETASTRSIRYQFSQSVQLSDTQSCLEYHFDLDEGESHFDHRIIVPLGAYQYPLRDVIQAGQAKFVRESDHAVLGNATVTITRNDITVTFSKSLTNENPLLTTFRFLPNDVSLSSVGRGMNGVPTFLDFHFAVPTGSFTFSAPVILEFQR